VPMAETVRAALPSVVRAEAVMPQPGAAGGETRVAFPIPPEPHAAFAPCPAGSKV
jgi:hypothetical protein